MEAHALCRILPDMTGDEYKRLVDDIRAKGLLRPITTFEGKILDGRHRYRACMDAGVEPRYEEFTGDDPVGFVKSSCMHRSLNATQLALVAAGFLDYERGLAKGRMQAGGGDRKSGPVTVPDPIPHTGDSRDRAGARMGVSGKLVSDAATVMAKAVPEVIEQMRAGRLTVSEAKRIVAFNPNAQKRIAALPRKDRVKEIEEANTRKVACRVRMTKVPLAQPPGTPYIRKFLSALESLTIVCAELGLKDASSIAARFMDEMDWSSVPLSMQFDRAEPLLRALNIIQQHKAIAA